MQLLDILKALSHQNRLRIINLLARGELCVCELENILQVNQSNVSRHLNKLKQAGIIKAEQQAQWVYYSLNNDFLNEYPFVKVLITEEFKKIELCEQDEERLNNYQESGITCELLREGKWSDKIK